MANTIMNRLRTGIGLIAGGIVLATVPNIGIGVPQGVATIGIFMSLAGGLVVLFTRKGKI